MRNGKNPTNNAAAATLEALHDNFISLAIQTKLATAKGVIAIMGGHKMLRADSNYNDIALISWELAKNGFLVASGGAGAMEAAHLGALFANTTRAILDSAIGVLKTEPKLPDAANLVDDK